MWHYTHCHFFKGSLFGLKDFQGAKIIFKIKTLVSMYTGWNLCYFHAILQEFLQEHFLNKQKQINKQKLEWVEIIK